MKIKDLKKEDIKRLRKENFGRVVYSFYREDGSLKESCEMFLTKWFYHKPKIMKNLADLFYKSFYVEPRKKFIKELKKISEIK